jgi:hypothetical protein
MEQVMTDRELLLAAARAVGFKPLGELVEGEGFRHEGGYAVERQDGCAVPWNPLTDDGDALRLAVKLRLTIMFGDGSRVEVSADDGGEFCTAYAMEPLGADPYAATRRAIVRAAAAMAPTTNQCHPTACGPAAIGDR